MRRILALLVLLAIPAVAQFGGPMGGMRPGSMQGGGLLPGRGGDPLWVAAGPTKPTLDFDFAKRKDLTDAVSGKTSLVTFARSAAQSPGTYVGADGLIHDAAVNLALYSEQFDNATWTKRNSATIAANQEVSPDAKQTADLVTMTTASSDMFNANWTTTGVVGNSVPITPSFYLKKVSSTGTLEVLHPNGAPSGLMSIDFSALDAGWNRIYPGHPATTVSNDFFSTSSGQVGIFFRAPASAGLQFYLWGAQLEETDPATMAPTAYIHTTSQALAAPRFDHDPDFPYVENLLLYSEAFDNPAWAKLNGATINANVAQAPDGTLTADRITYDGTVNGLVQQTTSASGTITQSVYLRTESGTQTVSIGAASSSLSTVTVTTDWQRFTHTGTGAFPRIRSDDAGSILAWGAQLETGSSVGQYVKTEATTRKSQGNVTTNLLQYSESLGTSPWNVSLGGGGGVTENQIVAPDGTLTADKLEIDRTTQSVTNLNGDYTFSVYAKAGTNNEIQLLAYNATTSGIIYYAKWNLDTQAVTAAVGIGTNQIVDAGGGWYRCSITFNVASTSNVVSYIYNKPTLGAGNYIYAWGAQLEATTTLGPYVRTLSETRSISDANAESLGLLVEEARTNVFTYSEQFDNAAWGKTNSVSVTANQAVSPDGQNTAELVSRTGEKQVVLQNASAGTYVLSVFAKANGASDLVTLASSTSWAGSAVTFDLSAASAGAVQDYYAGPSAGITLSNPKIESYGNGWYRCSVTVTRTGLGAVHIEPGNVANNAASIFLFGAVLESGTFPTSYIPTVTSQTRYADVAAVQDEDFSTTNLANYSESFDVGHVLVGFDAFGSGSIANAIESPDGQITADFVRPSTGTGTKYIDQIASFPATATKSYYVKDSGVRYVQIAFSSLRSLNYANYDLQNVEVTQTGGAGLVGASISDEGNGWRRLVITETGAVTTTTHAILPIPSPTSARAASFTGDGVSGFYVWGESLTATEYPVPYTTTRNLLVDSQDFERGTWFKRATGTYQYDVATAPDGTLSAMRMTDAGYIARLNHPTTAGVTYTTSIFVKDDGAGSITLYSQIETGGYLSLVIDTVNWTVISNGFSNDPVITDVGNGWHRIALTETSVSSGNKIVAYWDGPAAVAGAALLLYGAQLEPGTTATDYVRTVDVVGKDYGWYEPTEGTMLASGDLDADISYQGLASFNSSFSSFGALGYRTTGVSGSFGSVYVRNAGADQMAKDLPVSRDDFSVAMAMAHNDGNFAADGTVAVADTTITVPIFEWLQIGYKSGFQVRAGHIKRLTYWPRRQSDSTLQVITQ